MEVFVANTLPIKCVLAHKYNLLILKINKSCFDRESFRMMFKSDKECHLDKNCPFGTRLLIEITIRNKEQRRLLSRLKKELEKHSIDFPSEQLRTNDYKREKAQR